MGLLASLQAALGNNVDPVLEIMRTLAFVAKDNLGVSITAADLPNNIIAELKGPVLASLQGTGASFTGIENLPSAFNQAALQSTDDQTYLVSLIQDLAAQSLFLSVGRGQVPSDNPKVAGSPLQQGTNVKMQGIVPAHPVHTVFDNPPAYFQLFNAILPGNLPLDRSTLQKIATERNRVRNLRRSDFETMRDTIRSALIAFGDFVGVGDATYDATYNRPVINTDRTPTDNDWDVMFQLNALLQQLDALTAYGKNEVPLNPLDYVANFANQAGINFQTAQSKFAVPFPYGATLERLALQYLGDASRWPEIATLNGLREPYIDESGFTVPLLTSGSGTQVTVGSSTNLQLNQLVYLQSNNTAPTQRHIIAIRQLNVNTYVLTLDGEANLSNYTTTAGASLQAWLPGTVNSRMMLYIPSDQPPQENDTGAIQSLTGVDAFVPYLSQGGQDLLLDSSGDLAVTPDGDLPYAVGLQASIQNLVVAINTPKGSLPLYPTWGMPKLVGTSIADVNATDLLAAAKQLANGDPLTSVQAAAVSIAGPVAKLALGLSVAGSSSLIALSFDLQNGGF